MSAKRLIAAIAGATEMGGLIYPPLPALYHRQPTIADMIDRTSISRVIDSRTDG